jgi:hypothetical protein
MSSQLTVSFWVKRLLAFQILTTVCCVFLAHWVWGFEAAVGALVGGVIIGINLFLTAWVWQSILLKKVFALPIALIVIKYALLMIFLYTNVASRNIHVGGLGVGLGSVVVSLVAFAIYHRVVSHEDDSLASESGSEPTDTSWVDLDKST